MIPDWRMRFANRKSRTSLEQLNHGCTQMDTDNQQLTHSVADTRKVKAIRRRQGTQTLELAPSVGHIRVHLCASVVLNCRIQVELSSKASSILPSRERCQLRRAQCASASRTQSLILLRERSRERERAGISEQPSGRPEIPARSRSRLHLRPGVSGQVCRIAATTKRSWRRRSSAVPIDVQSSTLVGN